MTLVPGAIALQRLADMPLDGEADELAGDVRACIAVLDRQYDDVACNVTRIFGRHDLLLAMDLVWFSILQFPLEGVLLDRGWTEVIVPGDTRTGKSTVAKRMRDHYGLGELITGENVSYAGLIGGVDEAATHKFIKWGILPRNDGGLVVIDEVQEMDPELIVKISSTRSSGLAEVRKIREFTARARVRMVWIGNPRHDLTLAQFNYGCYAVQNIVGKPEDIARFDFACSAGTVDVHEDVLRRPLADWPRVEHRRTRDLAGLHVIWAWTRKPDQVVWEPGAELLAIERGIDMAGAYSQRLPLVVKAEQKVKIARLAVALAARLFSHPPGDRERVLVRRCHVALVHRYLQWVYRKASFQYDAFSRRGRVTEVAMREQLAPMGRKVIQAVLDFEVLRKTDLRELLNDGDRGDTLWSWLLRNGCLERGRHGMRKRPLFADALRELEQDPTLPEEPADGAGAGSGPADPAVAREDDEVTPF